jgi:DHA1 family bicyclomycin/chloramphenicol resistance-like MFS transporter
VVAPGVGQLILLVAPWRGLFVALTVFGALVWLWTFLRLPETLTPERRRPLDPGSVTRAFVEVIRNRIAFGYTLASMFMFAAPMAYLSSADQVFGQTFELGALFPLAFGAVALALAAASILNARLVGRFGMRRISHLAAIAFAAASVVHAAVAAAGGDNLWVFMTLQMITFFAIGLMMGNFSALALEPLGHVAGVASSTLGFATLAGGAAIGAVIARAYDGSTLPLLLGFAVTAIATLLTIIVTEHGRLLRAGAGHEADGA